MSSTEQALTLIGFGQGRSEPRCWRTVRLGRPVPSPRPLEFGIEPACSRALKRWRDVLARDPEPTPYRISRLDS